jgi:hypothetical protein
MRVFVFEEKSGFGEVRVDAREIYCILYTLDEYTTDVHHATVV